MPGETPVEPLHPLLESGERHGSGREAHSGADGADIVQMVVQPLQFEQYRAGAGQFGLRPQPQERLGRLGVGHGVADGAGGAGALRVGQALLEGAALRGPLQAAVLVEEAKVEMEHLLPDHVEAEVARFDDPGVDGTDGDLVHVVARGRHHPLGELRWVRDQRP